MFKPPDDKSKKPDKPGQAHLGNHLTDFATDLLLGSNKQDRESIFKPSSWTNKPKQDKNKPKK